MRFSSKKALKRYFFLKVDLLRCQKLLRKMLPNWKDLKSTLHWMLWDYFTFFTKTRFFFSQNIFSPCHCVKGAWICSFSGVYFPALVLNKKIYSVDLRIQSECRKIRATKTQNADTYHVVCTLKSCISRNQQIELYDIKANDIFWCFHISRKTETGMFLSCLLITFARNTS